MPIWNGTSHNQLRLSCADQHELQVKSLQQVKSSKRACFCHISESSDAILGYIFRLDSQVLQQLCFIIYSVR